MTTLERPPIFILGMLQRTGTNHLWDLFGLHPDVELLQPVFEDHLVRWSPHLLAYVEDVTLNWSPEWEVPPSEAAALRLALGDGVARWLADRSEQRIVTKMPTVEQAGNYFELFAGCPLVVLVRDGRNVATSMTKSFDQSYEQVFRRWRRAADIVLQLRDEHGDRNDFDVVRYEDVVDAPVETMRRLCVVTGLDPDRYPYEQIESLPVRGSSTLRSDEGTDVHWSPVERTAAFDPHSRWADWDDHLHRRFAAVAGEQQRALGYDLVEVDGSDGVGERLRSARDRAHTRYREARVLARRTVRNSRRVHGRI